MSMDVDIPERLWSVKDAAKLLGVTTKTIYRHIRDGSLPAVRVGPRLLRIQHQGLTTFLTKSVLLKPAGTQPNVSSQRG